MTVACHRKSGILWWRQSLILRWAAPVKLNSELELMRGWTEL